MPLYLTLSVKRYRSTVSRAIEEKEWRPPRDLDGVAIEKRAFRWSSTRIGQLIYIYIYIYIVFAQNCSQKVFTF